MRNTLIVATALAVAALLGACESTVAIEPISWLFAHSSESGEFAESDGKVVLTLTDPDASVVAFSDRPVREARLIRLEELVDRWDELFGDDPPNAAVANHSLDGGAIPVTIGAPTLDESSNTASFTILGTADKPLPSGSIDGVSVFIDPPAARLTDFHQMPLTDPSGPVQIPHVGGPIAGPGAPNVLVGDLPASKVGDLDVVVEPPKVLVDGSDSVLVDPDG